MASVFAPIYRHADATPDNIALREATHAMTSRELLKRSIDRSVLTPDPVSTTTSPTSARTSSPCRVC